MSSTKRPRLGSQRSLALTSQLEARPTQWAGHGVFALADLPAGWMWKDHPVCVPRRAGEEAAGVAERRLPRADDVDELMQELCERALAGDERCGRLLSGDWAMTHMARHLEAQGDGPDEMPQWALDCGTTAAGYNLLAAQLQSNVARHAEGGGFVLNPQVHAHAPGACSAPAPARDAHAHAHARAHAHAHAPNAHAHAHAHAHAVPCTLAAPARQPRLRQRGQHRARMGAPSCGRGRGGGRGVPVRAGPLRGARTAADQCGRGAELLLCLSRHRTCAPRRNLRRRTAHPPRARHPRADIGDELASASERAERQALLLRRWGFHCRCELCVAQAGEDGSGGKSEGSLSQEPQKINSD